MILELEKYIFRYYSENLYYVEDYAFSDDDVKRILHKTGVTRTI